MNKINYIHSVRGIAAFFIVLIHCNIFIAQENVLGDIFHHFLTEWTAVFLLISGFLFQFLLPRYNFMSFFKKKIMNVIMPYLLISVPAIMIYLYGFKSSHNWIDLNELLSHSKFYVITFFYVTGSHLGPLWFIPVLILIFFSSKPLQLIGLNTKILTFFSALSIIVIIFTQRPDNDSNPLIAYLHFLPVYIIGMYLCMHKELLVKDQYKFYYLSVFVALFFIEVVFDLNSSFSILNKFVLFLCLCSFFCKSRDYFILSLMADISFALYFLHGYFVGGLRVLSGRFSSYLGDGFWLGFALSVISAVIISFVVFTLYYFIKKANFINSRILIGS